MASLSSGLGNASASSLIRSARSLQAQVQTYQDDVQALTYANSAYTDDAFQQYQTYLTGRVNQLNSTGSIADATKAITMTKTLESATKSNISASITRENIQIMSGNATPQDKYNLIVGQYQRAMGIGDLTLAQTLENQAYNVNQSIQFQAQQAADARATLARAGGSGGGGSGGGSSSGSATYEGQVATNLTEGLKYLNGLAKNSSEKEMNATLAAYAKQAQPALNALGVHIAGDQPNYWDVVYGVAGAIYNAKVLQAQAEAATNPLVARTYASEAADFLSGQTKINTIGGSLTVQEIQQAQQDPSMFAFDNTNGTYKKTIQTGYQYMSMQNQDGSTSQQLVPSYSGMAQRDQFNKVYFLSPTETTQMTKLGLNFSENKSGTTGDGVQVQVSGNSPQWLKSMLGENGIANMYSDQNGFLNFKGASSSGSGSSFFTLAQDDKGLQGIFEHTADGATHLTGGDYGFNAGAVQLLINKGQQVQQQIVVAQAKAAEQLHIQQAQAQQQLQAQIAQQQQQQIAQQQAQAAASQARSLQQAASPQPRTYNPQVPTYNPQAMPTYNPQQTVNGNQLNQSGKGFTTLSMPHLNGIRL